MAEREAGLTWAARVGVRLDRAQFAAHLDVEVECRDVHVLRLDLETSPAGGRHQAGGRLEQRPADTRASILGPDSQVVEDGRPGPGRRWGDDSPPDAPVPGEGGEHTPGGDVMVRGPRGRGVSLDRVVVLPPRIGDRALLEPEPAEAAGTDHGHEDPPDEKGARHLAVGLEIRRALFDDVELAHSTSRRCRPPVRREPHDGPIPSKPAPSRLVRASYREAMPGIHPLVEPVAFLLGEWEGGGERLWPGGFSFTDHLRFTTDGRPLVEYRQTTATPEGTPSHGEVGYLLLKPGGTAHMTVAQPSGITETLEGSVLEGVLSLCSVEIGRTPGAKAVTASERRLSLRDGVLIAELAIAMNGEPLAPHTRSQLQRTLRTET